MSHPVNTLSHMTLTIIKLRVSWKLNDVQLNDAKKEKVKNDKICKIVNFEAATCGILQFLSFDWFTSHGF